MDAVLRDLAALRRAFYALVGSSSDDEALTDNAGALNETVDYHIQHGIWDAQEHLISAGLGNRWVSAFDVTREEVIHPTTDDRVSAVFLPDDFLRLVADQRRSAVTLGGRPWGQLAPVERLDSVQGREFFYLENGFINFTTAVPPAGLKVAYHYRHAILVDTDQFLDFPEMERPLIVAYAGASFADTADFTGDDSLYQRIQVNLSQKQARAARRARQTREPKKLRPKDTIGSHWMM